MPQQSVVITILPSSNLVFGGHVDYSVSPAISVSPPLQTSVRIDVFSASGQALENGFAGNGSTINPDGLGGSFPLGPTPSWSGGGGTGTLTSETFNAQKGIMEPTKRSTPVTFTVSA